MLRVHYYFFLLNFSALILLQVVNREQELTVMQNNHSCWTKSCILAHYKEISLKACGRFFFDNITNSVIRKRVKALSLFRNVISANKLSEFICYIITKYWEVNQSSNYYVTEQQHNWTNQFRVRKTVHVSNA